MNNPTDRTNTGRDPAPTDDSLGGEGHAVRKMIQRVRKANQPESTLDQARETPLEPEAVQLAGERAKVVPVPDEVGQIPVDSSTTCIGRFQIQKTLGRGGFGMVLLAMDPQLGRLVALKIPRLDALTSVNGRARFIREARAAALLGHPNIVSIYEAGQAGPVMYIALEYIDGEPLNQWLQTQRKRGTPPSERQVAELMIALAAGVQHAHQRGIVHRDLKPANILIERSSDQDQSEEVARRARIADFGLAYFENADSLETQSGSLLGTPIYVAPEQLKVSSGAVSPAVDIYGLGTILYELLTGEPPFSGPNLAAIARAVETEMPATPRSRNPHVSADLEAICLKCLEKLPARRYSSAAALQEDLERLIAGRPVQARRWTRREKVWRWLVQNRTVASLVTALMLALSIGLATAVWQAQRNQQLFAASESQRERAERHLDRVEVTIDHLLNDVADALEPIPQMEGFRRQVLESALAQEQELVRDERDRTDNHLRVARSLARMGEMYHHLGQLDAALASYAESLQILQTLEPADSTERADIRELISESELGSVRVLLARQQWTEATTRLERHLPQLEAWVAEDDRPLTRRELYEAYLQLARCCESRQDFEQALLNLAQSQAQLAAIPTDVRTVDDAWDELVVQSQTGKIHYVTGKLDQAIAAWQTVRAGGDRLGIDDTTPVSRRLNGAKIRINLGGALVRNQQLSEAIASYQEGEAILEALCKAFPLHQEAAQLRLNGLNGWSHALIVNRQIDDAIKMSHEALDWSESVRQAFGDEPEVVAITARIQGNLGNLLFHERQDTEHAIAAWRQQVGLCRKLVELAPETVAHRQQLSNALGNLATVFLEQQAFDEASPLIAESVREAEDAWSANPRNPAFLTNYLGQLEKQVILDCLRQTHDQAQNHLASMQKAAGSNAESLIFTATVAARCLTLISNGTSPPSNDSPAGSGYRTVVLDCLGGARQAGAADLTALKQVPEFSILNDDPEFAKMIDGNAPK